jgi:hypothetical protein
LHKNDQLHDQPRHGNASINPVVLAVTAFVTFGWTKKDSLTERFQTACDAARRLFLNKTLATTRQGLFSALGQSGAQLLKPIRAELIEQHKRRFEPPKVATIPAASSGSTTGAKHGK